MIHQMLMWTFGVWSGLPCRAALAGDKYIRSDIRRFLDAAEDTQKALWSACSSYARDLLSRGRPETGR